MLPNQSQVILISDGAHCGDVSRSLQHTRRDFAARVPGLLHLIPHAADTRHIGRARFCSLTHVAIVRAALFPA